MRLGILFQPHLQARTTQGTSTQMPTDGKFGFSVLVAGQSMPEYTKEGKVYIESDLCTPVSYYQEVEEFANGERECQRTPVTPYKLLIQLGPLCETSAMFVYVDGVQVARFVMEKNQSRYCFS